MSCSEHVLKELKFLEGALKTGNPSIKEQQELHKKLHSVKQQCNMTDMRQRILDEGGDNLGEFGNRSGMPPLSLALVGPAISSRPQPSVTRNPVLPSTSDLSQFQASQAPSVRDLSQFQASQAPSVRDLSQFRAQRGPSAEDFSKVRGELLKAELEAAKKARDPLWDFRPGEPVESRYSRALRNYSTWAAEESDRKFPFTSRGESRGAPRHIPQKIGNPRSVSARTLASPPTRDGTPTIPRSTKPVFPDDDDDDIYGENEYVDPRTPQANMSHLCPGPGCHYPRYDIRPLGTESEPKFKARMGGSSRRRSRKRTPQRKSRKRTPPKRSRTPQRKSRTPRRK